MSVSPLADAPTVPGQYWHWRGHKVYYVRSTPPNPQKRPLLLVHGFGASTDHWRKNIEGLKDEFDVWAIDLLGFGRSEKPALQYSGDLWRDQLHDFVREVIGRPAILAGNSLGGYACLCAAARRSPCAAGLILLNSAGPFSEREPKTQPAPWRQAFSKAARWFFLQDWIVFLIFQRSRSPKRIRKVLQQVYVDKSAVSDRLVEEIYRPSCDRGAVKVFASVFKSPRGETVDALLQDLAVPLLVLWGEGDPWMNARVRGAQFRKYYPNLSEYYLKAGHCPHDEVPEQVNGLIKSWVRSRVDPHGSKAGFDGSA